MMDFGYSLTYAIDETGYTKRTHNGFVSIPLTKTAGGGIPPNNADFYRERITPPLLPGFRRTPGTFVLSSDRAKLDFTITDDQLPPNVPPPGIILCSADHTVSCEPSNWVTWNHTLSASYEITLGGGATVAAAREAFFRLLQDRVGFTLAEIARLGVGATPPGGGAGAGPGMVIGPAAGATFGSWVFTIFPSLALAPIIPIMADIGRTLARAVHYFAAPSAVTGATVMRGAFRMSEPEIYGHTKCNYSCSWSVIMAELKDMLAISGLSRPTLDSDWASWSRSVADATSPRGHADLNMTVRESIVDLCGPAPQALFAGAGGAGGAGGGAGGMARAAGAMARAAMGRGAGAITSDEDVFPLPTPGSSWLSWRDSVTMEPNNNVVPVVTLPVNEPNERNDLFGTGKQLKTAPVDRPGGDVQRRKQSMFLIYEGTASRLGYPVPAPAMHTWGKVTLVPANRPDHREGFTSGAVGYAGCAIYGARWKLRYWVPEIPNS